MSTDSATQREDLIERGVAAILPLYIAEDRQANAFDYVLVKAVLDAILPQVSTVEELEALPVGSVLLLGLYVWIIGDSGVWAVGRDGKTAFYYVRSVLQNQGAILLWRPS
jgi:hypothetical protein